MPHDLKKVIVAPDGAWMEKSHDQYRNAHYMPPRDPAKTEPISRSTGDLKNVWKDHDLKVQKF